ncbi:hypothetical protein SUDANB135_07050 (plasmid) [Streptomyces sp. SudanB135_2055]
MEARPNGLHTEYGLTGDESAYFEGELVPTRHWDGPVVVDCHAEVLRGDGLQRPSARPPWYDDVCVASYWL